MKKVSTVAVLTAACMAGTAHAQGLGVSANYGLFAGPTLELTYPINDLLQVRGALSSGMGLSETTSDTDIEYDVETDGGIQRLALDYHPFGGTFFVSAGYALNSFKLKADGSTTGEVTIGDTHYTDSSATLNGNLDWESGATLSLGWGHSPARGWGAMVEIGAIVTGAPDVSLSGTGTVSDGATTYDVSSEIEGDLRREEEKIQNDVGDFDFLPILQAGVTYRF